MTLSANKLSFVVLLMLVANIRAGPISCPLFCADTWDPVCGSDGNTYANECDFNAYNCRQRSAEQMTIAYKGTCSRAGAATCQFECPRIYDPVCGSDGKTYSTMCDLDAHNCQQKDAEPVTMVSTGSCTVAKCPTACPQTFQPVCGTDGITYDNDCKLNLMNCQRQQNNKMAGVAVAIAYNGECEVAVKCPLVCPNMDAPVCGTDGVTYQTSCHLDATNCQRKDRRSISIDHYGACKAVIDVPQCSQTCPLISTPICGTDGVTYESKCHLNLFNCQKKDKKFVAMAYLGACEPEPLCDAKCPKIYDPVCGTNGKTFPSPCDLELFNCKSKGFELVKAAYSGACEEAVEVPECPQICPMISAPICGTDGQTYASECHLDALNCKRTSKDIIAIASKGECDTAVEVNLCSAACPMIWTPVCGSDGKTYESKCHLNAFNCQKKDKAAFITIAYLGECIAEPLCDAKCPKIYDPVCGTNGKTFSSPCDLELFNCKSKGFELVKAAYSGVCEESVEVPECPQICPMISAPICGTDGITYQSECHLKALNCKRTSKDLINVAKKGACEAAVEVPECPQFCTMISAPICGTDGITYQSECHLKAMNCQRKDKIFISVARTGACETEVVVPTCPTACPMIAAPICGTDGVTYQSKCHLNAFNCQRKDKKFVTIANLGACEPEPLCDAKCPKMYDPVCGTNGKTFPSLCDLELFNCKSKGFELVKAAYSGECEESVKVPECPQICPMISSPICGTDGQTYGSQCILDAVNCKRMSKDIIAVASKGECDATVEINLCPSACPMKSTPVCGSDGITYESKCHLDAYNCQRKDKSFTTLVSLGACEAVPICDAKCPKIYDPVCGTNGKTFPSPCDLELFNCKSKGFELVKAAYSGACEAAVEVPECPLICPMISAPICGTDGVTYASQCHLNAVNCKKTSKDLINVAKKGACEDIIEVPVCPQFCPMIDAPVCGTDGITYQSECHLKALNCQRKDKKFISIASVGACKTEVIVPTCPTFCPKIAAPICGTDGVTYESKCHLNAFNCQRKDKKFVTIANLGACEPEPLCDAKCPKIYDPVCGTNGKTFPSPCDLELFNCKSKGFELVKAAYSGACEESVEVPECPQICPMISAPICGTDGQTYSSQCILDAVNCKKTSKDIIAVASKGACDPTVEISLCPSACPMKSTPVCGSDGITYESKCHLDAYNCQRKDKSFTTLVSLGACETASLCDAKCPKIYDPVCGTNGKTFPSLCDLELFNCKSKGFELVKTAYSGACEAAVEVPECPQICPMISAPVCGSDGKIYASQCQLDSFNCKKTSKDLVAVVSLEACKAVVPDPECPQACPMMSVPVCGSDGITYESECHLKAFNCQRKGKSFTTLVSKGACDEPAPLCNTKCPKIYDPVCGTNGKTFPSPCDLELFNCKSKGFELVKVAYSGACEAAVEVPECPQICPMISAPICGTDGQTYSSQCILDAVNCKRTSKDLINVAKNGACDAEVEVSPCPAACPMIFAPVCGSDGKTYESKCHLNAYNCQRKDKAVTALVSLGECNTEPLCNAQCPKIYDPVCGTNGKTFPTLCDLELFNCKSKGLELVKTAYSGACKETVEVPECSQICPLIDAPVCGTDGVTYQSQCHLDAFNCQKKDKSVVARAYDGACKVEAPCPAMCPKVYDPICGSDGQTYTSRCALDMQNCKTKASPVTIVNAGACSARCNILCPKSWDPVCGSDRTTYANECFLDVFNCQQMELGGRAVRITSLGEC